MMRRGLLLAAALAAAVLTALYLRYSVVYAEWFPGGGSVVAYRRSLPWGGPWLVARPVPRQGLGAEASAAGVAVYGWYPDGRVVELAEGWGGAAVPPGRLLPYLRAWAEWGRRHGLGMRDFEIPVIVLVAAPSGSGGRVLLDAYAATLRLDLLLGERLEAVVTLPIHGAAEAETGGSGGLRYVFRLAGYRVLRGQYLPFVAARVHGPGVGMLDRVHEKLLLYSSTRSGAATVFGAVGLAYRRSSGGGVERLGYTVPGPVFRLTGDRVWADATLEVYLGAGRRDLPGFCHATPSGPYCFMEAGSARSYFVAPAWSGDYLASIGLEADIAEAVYQLVAVSGDGVNQEPLPIYYNVSMARPVVVHDPGSGEVFIATWAEAAPLAAGGKALQAFRAVEASWRPLELGVFSDGYDVDNWILASRVGAPSLLSTGLALGPPGLEAGLRWIPVGVVGGGAGLGIAFADFDLSPRGLGRCSLRLRAYTSPAKYRVYGPGANGAYSVAVLYIDAYAEAKGSRP